MRETELWGEEREEKKKSAGQQRARRQIVLSLTDILGSERFWKRTLLLIAACLLIFVSLSNSEV